MEKFTFNILISFLLTYIIIYTFICTMFKNNANSDKNTIIADGYYNVEKFVDNNISRSHSNLYKYYYKQENDIKFENNENYKKIDKNETSYYISKIKNFLKNTPGQEAFDLNESNIDENDYCYIDDDERDKKERFKYDFSFYYYKIDKHILYHVYCNV